MWNPDVAVAAAPSVRSDGPDTAEVPILHATPDITTHAAIQCVAVVVAGSVASRQATFAAHSVPSRLDTALAAIDAGHQLAREPTKRRNPAKDPLANAATAVPK